jgi:uncharacterized protein (UPF0276 family)
MNIAINYSTAAASLLNSGDIHIDLFKTPDWEWMVDEAIKLRPVDVHFSLEAGNGNLTDPDWNAIETLLKRTRTPYVNLHLDAHKEHFSDIAVDSTRLSDNNQVIHNLISDVKRVVERLGRERVIVENSPYRGEAGHTLRSCVEPEIITQVVEDTGCGFLLDISHALISAFYMGFSPEKYFAELPVKRIRELHFAGVQKIDGILTDHLSITDTDWIWLDWVIGHIKSGEWNQPWLLAFEYGGVGGEFEWRTDPAVIKDQLPRLFEHLEKIKS